MRKPWLAPVLLAAALVFQLTVLNRLRLTGGGVPDLMLVLVASLAMVAGPVPGMVTGFAAGLCLDVAPPGSQLIGQYALVFCLAGWASGQLSRAAGRSPLRALGLVAGVVVAAEALAAGLGLVLEPAQVTTADVRQVLPATIGYDLLLCPFVLYLVVLGGALAADGLGRRSMTALLAAPVRSPVAGLARRRQARCRQAHTPACGATPRPRGRPDRGRLGRRRAESAAQWWPEARRRAEARGRPSGAASRPAAPGRRRPGVGVRPGAPPRPAGGAGESQADDAAARRWRDRQCGRRPISALARPPSRCAGRSEQGLPPARWRAWRLGGQAARADAARRGPGTGPVEDQFQRAPGRRQHRPDARH